MKQKNRIIETVDPSIIFKDNSETDEEDVYIKSIFNRSNKELPNTIDRLEDSIWELISELEPFVKNYSTDVTGIKKELIHIYDRLCEINHYFKNKQYNIKNEENRSNREFSWFKQRFNSLFKRKNK